MEGTVTISLDEYNKLVNTAEKNESKKDEYNNDGLKACPFCNSELPPA
jgi:hypothetical protein